MKKNIKIKKGLKAALSLVLCVVMFCSSFACVEPGMFDFDLSVKADAADAEFTPTTIGRITQEQVVGVNTSIDGIRARDFWYNVYANGYFGGHSMPTDIVIPGLGESSNYTPQGMTYWAEKNWILISAYDDTAKDTGRASCIYAIDVESGKFVALFNILNSDGTNNTSHGGGIAASEHNFYFADSGSNISYIPLSEFRVDEGTEKSIKLKGTLSFEKELKTDPTAEKGAATSYCCYDEGVLWTGNFYYSGDSRYSTAANSSHKSMLMGYKLYGDSSEEEWAYLCGKFQNLINVTTSSGKSSANGAEHTWAAYKNGTVVDITGDITSTNFTGELCPNFGSMELVEGETYVIEFVSTNNVTDMYMFSPAGTHCNIKQSVQSKKTQLADGRYLYHMEFTAGLKPSGADSTWPTTQSTDGSYTGIYTIRFDQDEIQAGETRSYAITDIVCTKKNNYNPDAKIPCDRIHFAGTAGYPTYVVAFPDTYTTKIKTNGKEIGSNLNFDKIQYAMVDNGRIYVSRSWSRIIESTNYTSEIDVIDIDLDVPGTSTLTINGEQRSDCYVVADASIHQFHNLSMGEALCVIDDYLYTFTESAAYYYRQSDWDTNKAAIDGPTNVASQPVDVVWKIDQYAMMGEDRLSDDNESKVSIYEKVKNISELKYTDEYMIVYESETTDSNGQKIMYALDSYGGFKDGLVPKNNDGSQENTADSLGIVGHAISRYSTEIHPDTGIETLTLYSPREDDRASTRWKIIGAGTGSMRIENQDTYFGLYKNLYFGSRLMYMMQSEGLTEKLDKIKIQDNLDETFSFYYDGDSDYYLWCNDGSVDAYMDAYNAQYNGDYAFGGDNPSTLDKVETNTRVKAYAGQMEQPGTFHSDAYYKKTDKDSGNRTLAAVPDKYTKFSIYRRADDINTSGKSGLYTNLDAELKDDGTYTLTLESFSTGQKVTKTTTQGKPIDFVFVLDASASMVNYSDINYYGISDNPEPYDYTWAEDSNGDRKLKYNDRYYGTWHKRSDQQSQKVPDTLWGQAYERTDYWRAHSVNTHSDPDWGGNGKDYYIGLNSEFYLDSGDENAMCLTYGFKKNPDKSFAGGYYWTNRYGDATRLDAMKQSTLEFIEQIAEHAEKTGIQHRIAIVQYGSTSSLDLTQYYDEAYYNTGMYSTTTGVTMQEYSSLKDSWFGKNNAVYENAFFPATHDNLEAIIRNISVTDDADTFVGHGMSMALCALADQMPEYNKDGEKIGEKVYGTYEDTEEKRPEDEVNAGAVVINITDGAPGYGGDDEDAAYEAAQEALARANIMKLYDAEIYTVQMGRSTVGSFSNADFLDALSSNYNHGYTTSMYDEVKVNKLEKGDVNGSGYYFEYDLAGTMDLNGFFESLWDTSSNSVLDVETVELNSNSILQHKLGDMFKLTDASTATAQTADIYYDSLGVVHEETRENASATVTKDVNNNTVQLTGFDYSTNYVADGNQGQKLFLTIDNVLLNPDATSADHGISNQANTAIYEDSEALSSNAQTQGFPQVNFAVPEYTYVSDFGLNMRTQPLIGTPLSVDDAPVKQAPYATEISSSEVDMKINGNTANQCTLDIGINPTSGTKATGYSLVKRLDGGYYWVKYNVIPASNVYFEEDDLKDSEDNKVGNKNWELVTTASGYRDLPGETDIYGYDEYYDNTDEFSNKSHLRVDVTNKKGSTTSKKKTFQFTGTGFDLVSACGKNTGVLTLVIRDSEGKRVKNFMVDTYYNDDAISKTALTQVPIVSWSGDYGTYTVEVAALFVSGCGSVTNRSSSTIKNNLIDTGLVMNSAKPTNTDDMKEILENAGLDEFITDDMELIWFDDNSVLNGGTGVAPSKKGKGLAGTDDVITLENYIDGFRVYNPLDEGSSVYSETENQQRYANIVDNLAHPTVSGAVSGVSEGIAYITGTLPETDEDGNEVKLSISNYESVGPKNELYLEGSKTLETDLLTFPLLLRANEKVMLGLRAVNKPTTIEVASHSKDGIKLIDIEVSSRSELYYDITNCLSDTVKANGTGTDGILITIKNTGDGMLAVNHLKLSGVSEEDGVNPVLPLPRSITRSVDTTQTTDVTSNKFFTVTEEDLVMIEQSFAKPGIPAMVKNGVVVPIVEEEGVTPDDTTTPDAPEDDNTNGDTDTDNGETGDFSIFSLLELLLSFIEKILHSAFGGGNLI